MKIKNKELEKLFNIMQICLTHSKTSDDHNYRYACRKRYKELQSEFKRKLNEELKERKNSFSYVKCKGAQFEGTIDLYWKEEPIKWIGEVSISRGIMKEIPEKNGPNKPK